MGKKEKESWRIVWEAIALMLFNALLGALSQGAFGLSGPAWYVLIVALCVLDLVMVYRLVRKLVRLK